MSTGVARTPDPQHKDTLEHYASAMKLFGQQKFERAKPLFEKVCASPFQELSERAKLHLASCNGRLHQNPTQPKGAEEFYQHAVVQMNAARYQEAEELLTKAVKSGGSRAHYAYALACLRALTKDADAALVHLKEAIGLDPHCRSQARNDRDFDGMMDDPRFTEILYPERA